MPFNFDAIRERRGTDSQKWQKYAGRDIVPMWVADMDFAAAPEILNALHERVDHGIFGYARPVRSTVAAVQEMLSQRFGWEIDPAWIVWLPGLVVGLNVTARAVAAEGDGILTATPVYPPFLSAPRFTGRQTQGVPLARRGAAWEFDWDRLEAAVTPRTRAFFLCNPHNPVGRVYRREELERLAQFCVRHDLVLCSDEIHCDLILDDLPHIPTATLGRDVAARTITLMAPSKTYNLPGLGCSFAIIPDESLRTTFVRATAGIVAEVNSLGFVACEAAYRHGETWRQELLAYLRGNRDLIEKFVAAELPGVSTTHIEATYLAWLNVESLGLSDPVGFFEQAGVGLSDGRLFDGRGYVRLNFGCPGSTLREGLTRMRAALDELKQA